MSAYLQACQDIPCKNEINYARKTELALLQAGSLRQGDTYVEFHC